MNSYKMDTFYTGNKLTYKDIGGLLNFYFFAGSSPLDMVQQFIELIGHTAAMHVGFLAQLIHLDLLSSTDPMDFLFNSSYGIVHGDVKPTNVLMDDHMEARISHFLLAKLMEREATMFSKAYTATVKLDCIETKNIWSFLTSMISHAFWDR